MHNALLISRGISSDTFPELYNWFYNHPVFERWVQGVPWQLQVIGGPGSGKSTLAALLSEWLDEHVEASTCVVISASIYEDVANRELELLEDLLIAMYEKLETSNDDDEESEEAYFAYLQERKKLGGCRINQRLQLIRKAVESRLLHLPKSSKTYLVLDGYDCCSQSLKLLLEIELAGLQQKGLNVVITSRIATFENIESRCDHLNHGGAPNDDPIDLEDREVLELCLECEVCGDIMCFPCQAAERICGKCGNNDSLREPYEFVNIQIGLIPQEAMGRYVSWSLEREHGDLKLGSSARKPPLSTLGQSMFDSGMADTAGALVDRILDDALGNVGLAKARIDLVHDLESISDLEARRDQLPANILSLYDAGIRKLEARPQERRDLAVKAIAAAGRDIGGVSIPLLQRWLHQSVDEETRSGEDILEAANGFLFAATGNAIQNIQLYHTSFYYYVVNRHNVSIFEADGRLRADNARKMSSFAEIPSSARSEVRFEPLSVTDEPAEITPSRLQRTVTAMDPITEGPSQPFILRKGTRAWG